MQEVGSSFLTSIVFLVNEMFKYWEIFLKMQYLSLLVLVFIRNLLHNTTQLLHVCRCIIILIWEKYFEILMQKQFVGILKQEERKTITWGGGKMWVPICLFPGTLPWCLNSARLITLKVNILYYFKFWNEKLLFSPKMLGSTLSQPQSFNLRASFLYEHLASYRGSGLHFKFFTLPKF